MPETLRAYVERMARFTTIEDEFMAETEDGEALRERYEDADEYRADLDDDRLCGELNTLEEMIRDARELLAQPDPTRAALEAAEHWIEEQAWSPIAENGEILRTIRDALGKPHDAPDAAPAAPQTPDASALMLEALRLALPVCEDAYEDAKLAEGVAGEYRREAEQSTAAALAAWEAVKAAIAANGEG